MASQEKQSRAPQHPAVAGAAGGLVLDPVDVTRMLALKQHGWGAKRIARELGIARGTVRRYLRLGGYRPYVRRKTPRGVLEHLAWLKERFLAVRGNARVLLREAQQRGIQVAYSTLARVIKPGARSWRHGREPRSASRRRRASRC